MYRNAQDFRTPSRRAIRRIASYVTDGATPKAGEKTSRPVPVLTEIALIPDQILTRADTAQRDDHERQQGGNQYAEQHPHAKHGEEEQGRQGRANEGLGSGAGKTQSVPLRCVFLLFRGFAIAAFAACAPLTTAYERQDRA